MKREWDRRRRRGGECSGSQRHERVETRKMSREKGAEQVGSSEEAQVRLKLKVWCNTAISYDINSIGEKLAINYEGAAWVQT